MHLELVRPQPSDVPELARILYEAFGTLHDRCATPRDFPVYEAAEMAVGICVRRSDFYGVAARLDGRLVGSNFLMAADEVAGVGPITIDPACQARGVGRRLMADVIDQARQRGIAQVRLFQEAVNTASLSLYASLGFAWRDTAAVMDAAPAPKVDASVRPMAKGDLGAVEDLGRRTYGSSRRKEVEAALESDFPAFVRERSGRIRGYLLPGFFGHGGAETQEDILSLIGQSRRVVPEPFHRFLCPLSQAGFFEACLREGHRTAKVVNYMTLGPYQPPREVWLPSIAC